MSDDQRIERLSAATVERIAAGELITRPARAVGELLDNALDAGAETITVRIAGDGTRRLSVSDDGRGLSAADAERAVEPHTTSKLTTADDLDTVETLGFRGEGLASIVDAARKLELTTNDGGGRATRVVVTTNDGERNVRVEPASRDRGTTVELHGLFADRPARRESLADSTREFGRVSTLVARYALCRPAVAVRLLHDGREVVSTPGAGLTDALLAVYDRETASQTVELDHAGWLTGRLCYPSVTRADRQHVHCAINGRPVTNQSVRAAVTAGYDRLLADDEWPIAVVRLELPGERVDPNVHPAKARVAVADADEIAEAVENAVRDAVQTADLAAAANVATELAAPDPPSDRDARLADATYLGQYRELYLVCETEELLVVDQHAAHERVTFERLQAAVDDESVPNREIDPAAVVSTDPTTAATIKRVGDELRTAGFRFESFGGTSFRVQAVPAPLGRTMAPEAIREVALSDGDGRSELLAELACHPSLRAGETLDDEQARTLLDQLAGCDQPYACPHGRPTVVEIDEATLARGFDRQNTRLE